MSILFNYSDFSRDAEYHSFESDTRYGRTHAYIGLIRNSCICLAYSYQETRFSPRWSGLEGAMICSASNELLLQLFNVCPLPNNEFDRNWANTQFLNLAIEVQGIPNNAEVPSVLTFEETTRVVSLLGRIVLIGRDNAQ